jgi:transposase
VVSAPKFCTPGWPARPPGLVGAEGEARGQITLALVTVIGTLNTQIAVLDAEIGRLVAAHPDRHIFTSLPRSGTIRAASLLAEIGDCRQRFPTDDALAALAGACPSTRQSGKRTQAVFRWSCSKKLRAAVMDFANGSRLADPWAAPWRDRETAMQAIGLPPSWAVPCAGDGCGTGPGRLAGRLVGGS